MAISTKIHQLKDRTVTEYILSNDSIELSVLSQGASIYRLLTKDLDGVKADLVLGHKSIEDYLLNPCYLGATVGRYANRIAGASFILNEEKFLLSANSDANCLHGGKIGLHHKNWQGEIDGETLTLSVESPDGEGGFPGHLKVSVSFTLDKDNVVISYKANTDADTVINLTNHSYFNLGGHESGVVFEHELQIFADEYLEVNSEHIPSSKRSVAKTPFDFKVFKPLVAGLRSTDQQITQAGGYDHCFIVNDNGDDLKKVAIVRHPWSGRIMTVFSTEPGVQLYTANHIDGFEGKDEIYYGRYPAFCLETQHFPNSPNEADFPSTVLRAGETFNSQTIYNFSLTHED